MALSARNNLKSKIKNIKKGPVMAEITAEGSRVRVLVIPADEERMIARETIRALSNQNAAQIVKNLPIRRLW